MLTNISSNFQSESVNFIASPHSVEATARCSSLLDRFNDTEIDKLSFCKQCIGTNLFDVYDKQRFVYCAASRIL